MASAAWRGLTLVDVVRKHRITRPGAVAHRDEHWELTWTEYDEVSEQWAHLLINAGVGRGERIALLVPDGVLVHVAFLAAEKAGAIAVGIGSRAGASEVHHLMSRTGATALLSTPGDSAALVGTDVLDAFDVHVVIEGVELRVARSRRGPLAATAAGRSGVIDARRLGASELSIINSTSGTTGMPKCVMHNQNRWWYFHQLAVAAGALVSTDVFFSAVPMPFGFGLWTTHFTPAYLGAPVTTMQRFSPRRMIEAIERHRVTVLACVSTQFIMMLNTPAAADHDLSSLRALFTGGEAVPVERAAEFEERFGAAVLQFYGSNETGALSCTTLADERDVRLGTAGRVIDAMDVILLDDDGRRMPGRTGRGRPACKGPATSMGYWDDDEANRELVTDDGWMLMGDIVAIDGDGLLRVVGRTADFIIRGGKNISARAVESEVATHPGVALVAAVPEPDPVVGERVALFVVPRPGWDQLSLVQIVEHVVARGMSRDAIPELLTLIDRMPMSSGGKIAKHELRDRARGS